MSISIYLAGPMPTKNNWRVDLKNNIEKNIPHIRFNFFDPDVFENEQTDSTIVNYDKALIKRSDIVVANITSLSCGTSMEILFAYENNIPVLLLGDPNIFSPWHRHHVSGIAQTEDQLIKLLENYIANLGN